MDPRMRNDLIARLETAARSFEKNAAVGALSPSVQSYIYTGQLLREAIAALSAQGETATEAGDYEIGGRIVAKLPDRSWRIDTVTGRRKRVWFLCSECQKPVGSAQGETAPMELELRREWWLNHGTNCLPYGDDGEMQCCHLDFKREPLDTLQREVEKLRMVRAAKAWDAYQAAQGETAPAHTILDRWNYSGQPSVESYNHAVDVSNANYRAQRGYYNEAAKAYEALTAIVRTYDAGYGGQHGLADAINAARSIMAPPFKGETAPAPVDEHSHKVYVEGLEQLAEIARDVASQWWRSQDSSPTHDPPDSLVGAFLAALTRARETAIAPPDWCASCQRGEHAPAHEGSSLCICGDATCRHIITQHSR